MTDTSSTSAASVAAQNAALIAAKAAAAAAGTSTTTDTSSSGTDSSTTDAAASQTQLTSDVSFFLTMLTTQLQNQDPTAPMDTNEFTQQIATYSGVQQQVETNSNLEKLIAANQQSTSAVAVSYIGKEVESAGSTGEVYAGQGAFSYNLPSAAATVQLTIADAAGNTVFSGSGTTTSGENTVVWDGLNSSTGVQEPDGTYTLTVTATDANGNAITPTMRAVGLVSGVETDSSGNTILDVGDQKVNFTDVLAVREPTRVDTSSTASNSSSDSSSSGSSS